MPDDIPDPRLSNSHPPASYVTHRNDSRSSAQVVLREAFALNGTPGRVVEVGCGAGTWLRAALDLGAAEAIGIRGLHGAWIPPAELAIDRNAFVPVDLSTADPAAVRAAVGGRRFDLALSIGMAEHLPADSAPGFIAALCGLADLILFSAAIPRQGGMAHVNEAWPDYWSALFGQHGYECFDIVRPRIWLDPGVEWWHAQNILLFASSEAASRLRSRFQPVAAPLPLVHPRKYLLQVAMEDDLRDGLREATAAPFNALEPRTPEVCRLEHKLMQLRARMAGLETNLAGAMQATAAARSNAALLQAEVTALRASRSWRITAPLRALATIAYRLLARQ